MTEETIQDALIWVEELIRHYERTYDTKTALAGVLNEVRTCVLIGEDPNCEGTRFKEATAQLKQYKNRRQ